MESRVSTRRIDDQLSKMKLSLTVDQLVLKAQKKFADVDDQVIKDHVNKMKNFLSLSDIDILLSKLKEKDTLSCLNGLLHDFDKGNKLAEFRHILITFIDPISSMDINSFARACETFVRYNMFNEKMIELLLSNEFHRSHFEDISIAFLILKESNLYTKKHSELVLQFPDQAGSVTVVITASYYLTKPNQSYKISISETEFYNRLEKNFLEKKNSAVFITELHEFLREQESKQKEARVCNIPCKIF